MKMQEIKVIAVEKGIKPTRLKKADLIRSIQVQEGNFDCFGSASGGECDQLECIWMTDCFLDARKQGGSRKMDS